MRWLRNRRLVAAARKHYDEPHRLYHNVEHLDELIALATLHTPDLDDAEQWALLFHDAVYKPGAPRGENEKDSARLMQAVAYAMGDAESRRRTGGHQPPPRPLLPDADLKRARRIIEATTHAEPPPAEAARVCDLDLWRLAAPWEDFQRHALGIRHEYLPLHTDEAAFWKARHAFYEAMLAKPRLFATDTFRDRFEGQARENMKRALAAPLPPPVGRALPKTSRLEFRPFSMADLGALIDLHSDPDVMRWLTPDGRMWSRAELEARLRGFVASQERHGFSRWKVHRRDTGELIGRAGFAIYPPTGEVELGFSFRKSAWGQGYGSECADALVTWLFHTYPAIDHIIAFAQPANVGSCRILEGVGMRPTHEEKIGGAPYRFYRVERGR